MKTIIRHPFVQTIFSLLAAFYIRFCIATTRWHWDQEETIEAIWRQKGGVIVCFWHGMICLSPACWPKTWRHDVEPQTPKALISLSSDGQFIAKIMERVGFPAIRGSRASALKKSSTSKGGAAAFREARQWLKSGGGIAITPDGPKGPARIMASGVVSLASVAQVPVMLVALTARPAIHLKSWDFSLLPLPFAKGVICWDGPYLAPQMRVDGETSSELARDWGEKLELLRLRAEELLDQ